MFLDADTHHIPIDIFQHMNPSDYMQRLRCNYPVMDLDQRWRDFYDSVRDPSWPDCDRISDFPLLPLPIRQDLRNNHQFDYAHIDLDFVHVDDRNNFFPTIQTHEASARYLLKVDRQVLNPFGTAMMMSCHTPRDIAVDIMRTYNRGMQDICSQSDRFDHTLWLALQDIEASAKELDEFQDRDFFGIILNDNLPWAWISEMSPIFDRCARRRIPIYLHTGPFEEPLLQWNWDCNNERFRKQMARWPAPQFNQISQRWQAGIASFITEGVLDQWPDLRIVVCEHGIGWMQSMRDFMLSQSWPDPLPYFQRNFWVTCEPEEEDFINNARWVGWDRLLFATDYPHNDRGGDCRLTDVDTVTQMLENGFLTQHEFDLFTHLNYLQLKHRN